MSNLLRLYSIYDKKVEQYLPPMCFRTDAECIRAIYDAMCADVNNMYYKYSEDYAVYYLGNFDDKSCGYEVCEPIIKIAELSFLAALKKGGKPDSLSGVKEGAHEIG